MFFGRLECGHFAHPDFPTSQNNLRGAHFLSARQKLSQQKQGLSLSCGVILYPKADYSVSLSAKAASRPTTRCEKPEGRNLCFYKTSIAIA